MIFLLSGTIVSHSSKPTRGEAYELLVLDAENTVIPLFFVLINLAQSLNPNYLMENVLLSGTIVSHSSKPTRGEAYELLVLDAENTVIPVFFVLINLAQSLNPKHLMARKKEKTISSPHAMGSTLLQQSLILTQDVGRTSSGTLKDNSKITRSITRKQ